MDLTVTRLLMQVGPQLDSSGTARLDRLSAQILHLPGCLDFSTRPIRMSIAAHRANRDRNTRVPTTLAIIVKPKSEPLRPARALSLSSECPSGFCRTKLQELISKPLPCPV